MAVETPPKPNLFTVPNLLTLSRLGMSIILFVFIHLAWWIAAIVLFALACVTDWLDGIVARWLNQTSSFGRIIDPLVDKVLVGGAFIFLLARPEDTGMQAWIVCLVVCRELIITTLRSYLETSGAEFGAAWLGKAKMVLQCAALFAIFLLLALEPNYREENWFAALMLCRNVLIFAMVLATALSGLEYLWRAAKMLQRS